MSKINWAMIGSGTIAEDFAKAINEVNGNIYAIGSRTIEKAREFARKYNIQKCFGDYKEMLKDNEIHIVYISTPHCNHYEYIMECLENNKHVLCEKSITVNTKQLSAVTALAESRGLIVAEAMTIYHMPLYKKLSEIIKAGQIGKLKMIQVSFGSYKEYDLSNRFFSKELAGGALLDIGTYAISFARYFMNEGPLEIVTTAKKLETGVDEQSGIVLKNSLDEMAVISLTMRAKMPKMGVIAGELGFITVNNFPRADKAMITYLDGSVELIEIGETSKALNYEVEYMNICIMNDSIVKDSILNKSKGHFLQLSGEVMNIMDEVRRQWRIEYPFE